VIPQEHNPSRERPGSAQSPTVREWGVLKFFNTARGYGIIVGPRGDVFLGLGAVTRAGLDPWHLQVGVRLEYKKVADKRDERRSRAQSVRLLGPIEP
jgi:cold shock CspA family protein